MAATNPTTRGVVPAVNDIVAALVILGAYVVRIGIVAEGTGWAWWHLGLFAVTDVVLPILAGVWLLGVPVYSVWKRVDEE
jgi:hypothetical protein